MAYNPYDLRKSAAERQSQTRKAVWDDQAPDVLKQAQQLQQEAKRKRVLDLLSQNMNTGAPSAQDQREMRLTEAVRLEDQAKQQLEGYKQSQQREMDWDKAIRDAIMEMPAAGSSLDLELGKLPQKTINQTEAQHEAVADYFEQNRKDTQNRNLTEKDLEEVARMDEADRKLLETYASGRDEWFDHQKIADSISARAELEKKYDKQKVKELAESWQWYQNALNAERTRQEAQEAGDGFLAGTAHSAASVVANAVNTLSAPLGYLQEALHRTGRYQTLDPNNAGTMAGVYASAAREAVSEDMGTAGKVLYQGTMGALDNLTRIAMGGGTKVGSLGLAALGSFGSTLSEASAQGATPGQALGKAVLSSGIEVATEYVPLDELFKAGKGGFKGAKAAFRQALKQGGIEAAEEEIALLGNVLTDALVMREKSSYNQQIGELVANGMSYADAKAQADRALWDQAVNTALTSFVSGGVMSGAQSTGQYVGQQLAERQQMRNELAGQIQDMMQKESVGAENATTEKPTADEYIDAMAERLRKRPGTIGVDTTTVEQYNQNINKGNAPGGINYGAENDRAAGFGDPAQRVAGVQRGDGYEVGRRNEHGGVAQRSGVLRVSEDLQRARTRKGLQSYDLYDTSESAQEYEQALIAGRNSDTVNGWCVTPKSAQELAEGNVRTAMNADGTVGVGVAPDGDIVAVFKNKNGGPRKALDTAMPAAIEMGGDRLDCYGEGLVTVYEGYGFVPVARVEFNPEYANDGWTPEKGTPYIYVMMHNGDDAATVTDKMHSYKISTKAELDALPTYGKDGYDDAMAYRDSLFQKRQYAPQGAPEGFEAMGAASRGFTGKEAYYELLTDDNVKPERPGAVRPMEIPETDANGRRVTDFASNAAAAAATSDAMADALAELIGDGSMGFDTRGHKESLENARSYIEKNSMAKTAKEISDRVSKGMVQDGDVEKALLLYTLYGNQDNQEAQAQAVELLSVLGKMANISGRNLNLFGLLRKLTPEGQLQAVEDDIKRTIGDINKTRSGFKQITGEQMHIDEGLAEAFTAAETEEAKKEALDDIYKDVAARIKPTLGEAWDQWRNLAMLGNFKTHARNFLGSMAFRPYVAMKRTIGAALESAFVDQENRTKAVIGMGKESRALLEWAKQDAKSDSAKFMLNYSGTTGDTARSKIEENRKYLPGPLDKLRKGNMQLMERADMFWKRKEYALSLAGFLKARGYTAKQAAMDMMSPGSIPEGVMQEARAYATQEAMKATFNDRNKFSNLISRLRIKDNKPWSRAINVVTKGILPYARTPANVAVRAVEYSPAGLAEGFRQLAQDVKTGEATVSQGIDKIASGLTGTGAMVLGAALAAGLIPGIRLVGKIEDKDEEEPGAIEYSVKIGDTYYGIAWLAPANIPLFVGANLYGNLSRRQDEGDMDAWDVLSAMAETSSDALDPMLELSMLSSLNDVMQTAAYEESAGDKVLAVLASSATNYFTQGIPTLFGQIEQATEETKKSVYSNADNPLQRSFEKTVGRASQRLPGDLYQVERLDANGEPVRNNENWIGRAADALVNPATISKSQETEVSAELRRLNQTQDENVSPPAIAKTLTYTDSDGKRHENYRLSGEEYTALTAAQRGAENRIVADMLGNADYTNLPDEAKARAVTYAQSYAREFARGQVLPGYDGMDSWMQGIEGKEAGAIIQKVAAAEMSDAFTAMTESWREGYGNGAEAVESLEQAFNAFNQLTPEMQKAVTEASSGRLAYYLTARKNAIDTGTFVNLYRQFWQIDRKDITTSQKAQEWSYALERAYESRTITKSQRDVLKDEMVYMQMFPAETEKFDQLTESGLSADDAQDLGWLIQGLQIQEGYSTVRPVQKAEAIAGSRLSEADKIAALKIYGSDAQDENLDLILEMGGTAADYVAAWQIYSQEEAKGGRGTKARTIQAFMDKFGVDRATATAIYDIYH